MNIAYNPLSESALSQAPSDNDILFDLPGKCIYARGVQFKGTDTIYQVFKKNTSSQGGGYNGLVPAPDYQESNSRYLREDGKWIIPESQYRYQSLNNTDLDTLRTEGRWYYIAGSSNNENGPDKFNEGSELYVGRNADGYRYQKIIRTSGEVWLRIYNSSTWGAWKRWYVDGQVKQTSSTSDTMKPLVLGYTDAKNTSDLANSVINQVHVTTSLYANPKSGTLVANIFKGQLQGTIASNTTATTQQQTDNSTKVATTAFVRVAIANLVNGAPETLDTLKEIADYLQDGSVAGGIVQQLAKKVNKTGDTMSGDLVFQDVAITSDKYPFKSAKLHWSGGSDFASIYYAVTSSNMGKLVFEVGDDGSEEFIWRSSKNGDYVTLNNTMLKSVLNVQAPMFIGKLQGNADTATTANKLGSSTIGSATVPIYLNAGSPKACSSTSAATASTIAVRDGSGDLLCRLVRANYADQNTMSGGIVFRINNSGNNYLRCCNNPSAVRSWLGIGSSGDYVTALGTNGNNLTWTKNGTTNNIIIPYATNSGKVANSLVLKFNSGTTEGTNLYTFNGSSGKTIDIRPGSNVQFATTSGTVVISSTNTTYSQATSSTLGLVKIGYPESGKNYPVELNSSGQMYVNVPWTDNNTTYSAGAGLRLSGTAFSLVKATPTTLGGVKVSSTEIRTISAVAATTFGTQNRIYPVQLAYPSGSAGTDGNKVLSVYVPWKDTTYSVVSTSKNGLVSMRSALTDLACGEKDASDLGSLARFGEKGMLEVSTIMEDDLALVNKSNSWTAYQDFKSGAGNSGSDMRFKKEVEPVTSISESIAKLDIIQYIWEHPDEERIRNTFGVKADQLLELGGIFATMVHSRGDEYKTKWVEYDRFGVLAIKAIQELCQTIQQMKNRIEILENKICLNSI